MLATATVVVSVALRMQTQETCIPSEIHMVCMGETCITGGKMHP